jgi:Carboxypeptidase regulatory-like domain
MTRIIVLLTAWLMFSPVPVSFAQGVQSGTIRGVVRDEQNLAVPGATVTAASPAMQGPRSVITDAEGNYVLRTLPAGEYEVKFELSGFATITHKTSVALGLTIEQNVTLRAATVAETVQVVAETPAAIATPVVGATFKHDEIDALATPRSLQGIAQLAPALTENASNAGQLVINGAFGFDNVFMINGVDVNDNLFAQAQNLFIEDAIQETQILTSGISAEYGRFTGGVVNAITKSGGNSFSGTGRINFLNPSWTTATPFEVSRGTDKTAHPDDLQNTFEGTFGGPIAKDKLWFFTSGRYASVANPFTLPESGTAITQDDLNKRGEIKLTGTVAQNHTIQGGYLNNSRTVTNTSGVFTLIADPAALVNRVFPNWYYFTNYHGVLGNNLLAEAQYSQRTFEFGAESPSSTDIRESPFISPSLGLFFNAPYFDSFNDPEQRNNKQFTGSITNFWNKAGRHELKVGYEYFRSQRTGGNSQSATTYAFNSDWATDAAGNPLLDSEGRFIPVFVPGDSSVDFYPAVKGAVLNINNNSIYVQDHWAINNHLSADLGARFEHVTAVSTGDIESTNTSRIVPRLGVSWDVSGNGQRVVHLTYGQYSGRYNEAQIAPNSPVGNPADIFTVYSGPAGQGRNFAPGFDIKNYPVDPNASVTVPTINVFTQDLSSPVVHEFSTSYGTSLAGGKGYAEATYVFRRTGNLIEDFQTIADGFTDVVAFGINAGRVTNIVYRNTDDLFRQYQGLVFQARHNITNRWSVNGHYTLQLENDGNYEGEGTNRPGRLSFFGNYPEAFNADRNFPEGHLQDFQRNRLRVWSIYNWSLGRAGDLSLSGLWRVESALAYSLVARDQSLTSTQRSIIAAAGYPDAPSTTGNMVFFNGERGSEFFAGYGLLDTSVNYNIPVFRSVRPWVKFDVFNLFDNLKLIGWNTTISRNNAGPVDNLGLATTFNQGTTFGTGTGNTVSNLNNNNIPAYPLAFTGGTRGGRTFRFALGVRF